jgi:hypothetical protein
VSVGTVISAIVARMRCRHEYLFETARVRHPVTGELISKRRYLVCRHCLHTTDGWTLGGVQAADAPTRWIRRRTT